MRIKKERFAGGSLSLSIKRNDVQYLFRRIFYQGKSQSDKRLQTRDKTEHGVKTPCSNRLGLTPPVLDLTQRLADQAVQIFDFFVGQACAERVEPPAVFNRYAFRFGKARQSHGP